MVRATVVAGSDLGDLTAGISNKRAKNDEGRTESGAARAATYGSAQSDLRKDGPPGHKPNDRRRPKADVATQPPPSVATESRATTEPRETGRPHAQPRPGCSHR